MSLLRTRVELVPSARALSFLAGAALMMAGAARAQSYSRSGSYDSFSGSSRSRGYSAQQQTTYDLSVAAAVSAPSSTGFIGENPAGMIYMDGPSIQGFLVTDKDHPDLLGNGVSAAAGNGLAAASVGVETFSNATDDRGSITRFNFGLATYAEALNLAFGLNGAYRFTNAQSRVRDPGLEATWTANLGILFNPVGVFRLGLNLYELSKGMTGVGTGVSAHVNEMTTIALDAGTDNHGKGLTVKPGIGVHASALSLTYAYGMQVDHEVRGPITPGNTLGLGFRFSDAVSLTGYYNHFQTYFLNARIGF